MTRLTRYLVVLAGLALAMLMTVPSALAQPATNAPDRGDWHPDKCKAATIKVEKAKEVLEHLLHPPKLPPRTDTKELAVAPAPIPAPKPPTKEEIERAVKALHIALEEKHKACDRDKHDPKADDEEETSTDDTADEATADTSQVGDVPVGAVDTGGGPA